MKLFKRGGVSLDAFVKALKKDIHSTWHEVEKNPLVKAGKSKDYKEGFIDGLAYCMGAVDHYSKEFEEGTNE